MDDLADACVFLMKNYCRKEFVNVGVGQDITIRELAERIKKMTDFQGEIKWNKSKPNGTPRKLMDVSKLYGLNWRPKILLDAGLREVIGQFKSSLS